ncbi:MAG: pre-peptidase C-terminal domain-containing protein [Spirochaetia bacterium]|nr:pre-peptidase C-terminal domain-containing protein [Spirochaetia bacterium]
MKKTIKYIIMLLTLAFLSMGTQSCTTNITASVCGDWVCDSDEDVYSCAEDCGYCGDYYCASNEDSSWCSDCGTSAYCGDGWCDAGEYTSTCPSDCGTSCGDGACNGSESSVTCSTDCGAAPVCGDGWCDAGEYTSTCPSDCGTSCGDGACNGSETWSSCGIDCSTDADDSYSSANFTSLGSTISGNAIDVSNDVDYYYLYVYAGETITFETSDGAGSCLTDTQLYLYDSDGTTMLTSNDDGGSGNCSKITYSFATSRYVYIEVAGYLSNTGSYVLDIYEAPDLQPSSFSPPLYPTFSAYNTFSGYVYNDGSVDATDVDVDIYCSTDSIITVGVDTYLGWVTIANVPAGTSTSFSGSIFVSSTCPATGYFGYVIDKFDNIIEFNESNNVSGGYIYY